MNRLGLIVVVVSLAGGVALGAGACNPLHPPSIYNCKYEWVQDYPARLIVDTPWLRPGDTRYHAHWAGHTIQISGPRGC